MRRNLLLALVILIVGALLASCGGGSTAAGSGKAYKAPKGKMVHWAFGQPKFLQLMYDEWFKLHPKETEGVTAEAVATKGEEEVRQKTMLAFTSKSWNEMADVISTFPVSMQAMVEAGILLDMTEYLKPLQDKFVPGTYDQGYFKGKLWALPRSLRPQLMFYNKEILDTYKIDAKEMATFEGWLEVGRKLKRESKGQVFLSYVDPQTRTWRYWGRRGLMPQAGAKIWDDDGNVVIDKDPGALKALKFFETLHKEGLLFNSVILQPPLYEATRQGKVATFYIGAFYDEFLKSNNKDMAGKWRTMEAPVFKDLNLGGAPVVDIVALTAKPKPPYAELYKRIWYDYNFDSKWRQDYTLKVLQGNGPVQNPLSKVMLAEPFWNEPDPFYGGQSFKQMEGLGLRNVSMNMRVTTADAEADTIISAELEKFVAGAQTMDQAIAAMGKVLREKIGKAPANPDKK